MIADVDSYQEIINGPNTFGAIALDLQNKGRSVIGWTDGHHSHHDVLFTLCPPSHGRLANGLRGSTDLFVSIMRYGAFGFTVTSIEPRHPGYIAEKLGMPVNDTLVALTDLINGVLAAMANPAPPRLLPEPHAEAIR